MLSHRSVRMQFGLTMAIISCVASAAAAPEEAVALRVEPRASRLAKANEVTFLAESDAAMMTMMKGLLTMPTGNVDRDFVAMMVPHHQGAIDMARSELRFTRNRQLMRISQEIIVEQLQEIDAMRAAVGDKEFPNKTRLAASLLGVTAKVTLSVSIQSDESRQAEAQFLAENKAVVTKMMNEMVAQPVGDIDRDFVQLMAPHHQGAIDMARAELCHGRDEHLRRIAQEVIVDETQEITLMRLAIGQAPVPAVDVPAEPPAGRTYHPGQCDGASDR